MGLEYIQLFADMEALFEPYDDAQRGRLMMAMMAYAYRGEEPRFDGVEKFIWPVLKQHIDRCAANVEAKKAAGSKGGRNKSESKQTQADASKAKQSEAEESESKQNAHNHDHDNDHDHNQDHIQEKKNVCAREAAPAAAAEEPIVGIDGTDLAGAMADYDRAGELVTRFRLPDNDISRGAIIEDAEKMGWEKVEKALAEAAKANSRAMLSVNFYRAVLKNEGKPRAAAKGADVMQRHNYTQNDYNRMLIDLDKEDDGPKGKDGDRMMRHSANARKATYSAAVLDFDEE